MQSLINKFNLLVKYICVVSLTIMVTLIFVNTVLRYFVHSSIVATEELCRFFFVWATFMAVISVWQEKGHICVTALTEHLHGSFKKWFVFVWSFLTLFALGALAYGSYKYIQINSYYIQITGISYGFIILPVMLSAIACFIMNINEMLKILNGKVDFSKKLGKSEES